MKKFIAKEFLWLLITLVLAVPLSFLVLAGLDIVAEGQEFNDKEKTFVIQLFLIAYILNCLGIYLVRLIVSAVKVLAKPEEAKEK